MALSLCSVTAFAAENYTGKTVILYTANVRGDVDVYAKVAAAKTAYKNAGADVILEDAGNFLQGTAVANSDRGLGVYNLMDAVGYDVAAMGLAEFGYADATTGYGYHKNITKYYTQAELQNGAEALIYNKDMKGEVTADRTEKAAATFTVLSANATSDTEYYSFEASTVLTTKSSLKVGFYGLTATSAAANVQDGCLRVSEPKPVKLNADVTICLSNAGVCDNFLINGNDTYYTLKEAKEAGAAYANNGNGVKVRDAVAQYIQKQLNGVIGSSYASAQGRISLEKTDEVFHDVKAATYYADAVKWARENSIVNGTGKETFGPDANMTRAALWAVLGRAAGADVDGGSPWYQKALEWAKTEGISDGTNPNGSITRQELVTMLYRNAGKPAVSGDLAKFSDASAVASWASDAMIWAVSEGLVKGSGSNLNPTATATRAQVVTILYRLMEK